MGILQTKRHTTGKKALAYRGKGGQNTEIAFPALRLGVVLYILNEFRALSRYISWEKRISKLSANFFHSEFRRWDSELTLYRRDFHDLWGLPEALPRWIGSRHPAREAGWHTRRNRIWASAWEWTETRSTSLATELTPPVPHLCLRTRQRSGEGVVQGKHSSNRVLLESLFSSSPPYGLHFQHSGCQTKGVEFKGRSLCDGFGSFDCFGGFGKHLALLSLVLQKTGHRGNSDGFGGRGGSPLKLNPPFRHPETPENLGINWERFAVFCRILDDRFSARRLLCSFSALPSISLKKNLVHCLRSFLMGEKKTHAQNPPENPGTFPQKKMFMCSFLLRCVGFFRIWNSGRPRQRRWECGKHGSSL